MFSRILMLTTAIVLLLGSCVTYSDKDRLRTQDFKEFETWYKVNAEPLTGDGDSFLLGRHLENDGLREVYTNKIGQPVFQGGTSIPFPVGTIIVKDTFYIDKNQSKGRRWNITVMRKRNPGYDPEHGDWEYVTAGPRKGVRYQGTMELCIDCHIAADKDYVFTWR